MATEERRLASSGELYTEDDMNMARLDAGLYTLQQVRQLHQHRDRPVVHCLPAICAIMCVHVSACERLRHSFGLLPGVCLQQCRAVSSSPRSFANALKNHTRLLQCALIIGNLWLVGDVGIRKRVLTLLHQRSQTLADLRDVLKEHHDSLGDEGEPPGSTPHFWSE